MQYFFTHLIETERTESNLPAEKFNLIFFDQVLQKLRKSGIHNITHQDNKIKFSAPVFRFVWNGFNLFNPISGGEISIKNIGRGIYISYKIIFLEFFIYALIFSIIPAMGIFPNLFFRLLALGIIWMIYAISTLIAANRFEGYLRKLVNELNGRVKVRDITAGYK